MLVVKRNGTEEEFQMPKLLASIRAAFYKADNYAMLTGLDPAIIDFMALRVTSNFAGKIYDDKILAENIFGAVVEVLFAGGYPQVAKEYIAHRAEKERFDAKHDTSIDYKALVDSYIRELDWRVKENSTVTYSIGGLILSNSGAVTANYWLSEVYDKEIANAHRNADIHIHDLSMLSGYCFTGDTRVKTLDGKNPTFADLVKSGANDFWVYAYDLETQQIVPAKAINPRITRRVSDLVYVTLADDTVIKCTADHPFLLRNGEYCPANDLKPNMSLMPLYIGEKSKYVSINRVWIDRNKGYLHRWVAEQMLGRPLSNQEVVHHINGDKHDNRPENLCVMQSSLHRKMELFATMQKPVWKTNNNKRLIKLNRSVEHRTRSSQRAINAKRDRNGRFVSKFAYQEYKDIAHTAYNHSVRRVEHVRLTEPVDVYDLTVPGYANFAIEGNIFVHNCAGWSLKQLIQEGLGGVTGKITSAPAKHLATLCNQMVNFLGIMQNEWAGAQAFSSFDTYLAPFIKADNLTYDQTKKCIESFVYGVNTPSRWGTQAPFSNITLDWTVPDDLAELNAIVGGKEMPFKYKDCKKEMDMVNRAFIEVMIDGDANGRGFQYPIPTYSITKDFDWSETENNRLLFEMTAKYGTPYFSNYVNSDMEPSDIRSMCCRLRLDLRELRKKSGGYFGSGESTGSIGVVTINLPRIAYLSKDEQDFYRRLDKLMDIAARSLKIKRQTISRFLNEGLYPYTKRYLGTFNNHFSTIGVVGGNEAGMNAKWLQADLTDPRVQQFMMDVLNHMRERLSDYQEQYGDLYNLEATPAESTTYRFAKHDIEEFPDIITAAQIGRAPFYTNSTHLPVGFTDDVFEALDVQDKLQTLYTSGTVFHAFLGEKLPDWKAAANLVRKIAENYELPYYTLSPTYSVCKTHGYITGEEYICPKCGEPTEVYSRITGYYRPVQNWNDGKAEEFRSRRLYDLGKSRMPSTHLPENDEAKSDVQAQDAHQDVHSGLMLVATKTCPNCKMAASFLEKAHMPYKKVYVEDDEDFARMLNVQTAPTLVVVNDGHYEQIVNLSNIRKYIDEHAQD